MEVKIGVRVGGRETVLKILEMYCATSSLTVQTFFEASAAVITFVLAGRYVEAQMKLETGDAVRKPAQMTPLKAWVKTGGGFAEVDSAQVEQDQLVEMRKLFYPALCLKPELAGLAMALSNITITANALRLMRA